MNTDQIIRPSLLVDKNKCIANIKAMVDRAKRANARLRPHFKTHQSAEIGNWFKEFDIDAIAVSSLQMADYFAQNGWKDITLAIPVNIREIDFINELASKIKLNLLVESKEVIQFLDTHIKHPVSVYIKVDTGYNRCGLPTEAKGSIRELVEQLKNTKQLTCKGFLAHTGHNYAVDDVKEIHKNHSKTVLDLNELKDQFRKDIPDLEVSLGDTPACSISEEFYGIDEIRPGNFVFYDIMQYILGSCEEEQIAVAMLCPIIGKNRERNELVIHGGGVHFSKEFIEADDQGTKLFGSIVAIHSKGWGKILGGAFLAVLSQEHGVIRCSDELFNHYQIGDLIGILPVHSCMTVNLMKEYISTDGQLIECMK